MGKNAYIIAGPNGAGKTTFAREFLPKYADCKNFVNADLIAAGVSPFDPDAAALRAGRLMLDQIEALASRGESLGFETTLAGKAHLQLVRRFKRRAYSVHLFFLWIPDADFAVERVAARVAAGGHYVSETTVRRRFQRSISNFFRYYQVEADSWMVFDNSGRVPESLASGVGRQVHEQGSVYATLKLGYGKSL